MSEMNNKELREQLHKYIDAADNKDVAAFFSFIEGRNNQSKYSRDELSEFHKRRETFLKDGSKGYTVEEVHSYIRQMKNSL
jgi:hypothetical protein